MPSLETTKTITADVTRRWKTLVATDLLYKAIAYVFLIPVVTILFQLLLRLSGDRFLADQDILFFFLGPVGILCVLIVGAVSLAVVALEIAALMIAIADSSKLPRGYRWFEAIRYALSHATLIINVSLRIIGWTFLVLIPYLLIVGGIYWSFLSEFDINYYLKEWPPVFIISIGVASVLGLIVAAILLSLYSRWLFSLPLVLFEKIRPSQALRTSSERSLGHRKKLLLWILAWFVVTTGISLLTTSIVIGIGRWIIPNVSGSLPTLVVAIGICLLISGLISLLINILSTIAFASMLVNLFRRYGGVGESTFDLMPEETISESRFQFGRRWILGIGLVGIVVATWIGINTIQSVRLEDDVQIVAHRGASYAAPENTMAAIRLAIEEGADWVEIDVQESADGEVVVFHDSDFMKLAGKNLKIWDATAADLEQIDIGSWMDPKFSSERVPTLTQVLEYCKGKVKVDIELKYYGHEQKLEDRVIEVVESTGMVDEVVFMSLKKEAVTKMKQLRPDWVVGLLMSITAGRLEKSEADFFAVNAGFADWNLIRRVHAMEKEVWVWTVNDPVSMSNMIGRGVDGLITDKPGLANKVLAVRADLGLVERLILEVADVFGISPEIKDQ